MRSGYLSYKSSSIHYLVYGTGTHVVVAFHGYAEDASSFACLAEFLPADFRLIAIDLPFHGLTTWQESRPLTKSDLGNIIDAILAESGINLHTFTLMGYSLGGRIALALTEHLKARISRLLLLAPDGIKINFWYWLATQTRMGNRLFRFTMRNPKWFIRLLSFANHFNLVNKSIYKFVQYYLNDTNIRSLLYERWTCMRRLTPDPNETISVIKENKIPVRMVYGKHDRIIRSEAALRFCKDLTQYCQVHIIDSGHQVLHAKHAKTITSLLQL